MQRERKPKNFLPKPTYKGGPKAMSAFIAKHLRYPEDAQALKIEGTVVLRIEIDYKGKVIGSKVKSSLGHGCDEEAQRLVNLLSFEIHNNPRRGKVIFHKNINIHFRLSSARQIQETKKAEPASQTQLLYRIVTREEKKEKGSSYSYSITI